MNCLGCGVRFDPDIHKFRGCFEWGVASNEVVDLAKAEIDPEKLDIYFEIRAHFPESPTAEYADLGAGHHFTSNHPFIPKPDIIPLRNEFWFCSTNCMRSWFNRIIDDIETSMETGDCIGRDNPTPL